MSEVTCGRSLKQCPAYKFTLGAHTQQGGEMAHVWVCYSKSTKMVPFWLTEAAPTQLVWVGPHSEVSQDSADQAHGC
jgi:hypothetical protein